MVDQCFNQKMKKYIFTISSLVIFSILTGCGSSTNKMKNILIFSKTVEFRHDSIEPAIAAIKGLGIKNNFHVFHTEDASVFNRIDLKSFHTVIFLNTSGDVLDSLQEENFKKYIQDGGGWVGVHCATDTETDWFWYGQLAGAYFDGHPEIQKADLIIIDTSHSSTKNIPDVWSHIDEWYNFNYTNPNINILINLDENSYEGGTNGSNHPISWSHSFDGGRAFYTALGHTVEAYSDKYFLSHLLGGIQWTTGDEINNSP
jgi:type 1 glutamine amidotransferase|tara:strand:+ start:79 stop:852 length:774 start_codon:yes stop_codon:yes gene_type:complete